MKDQSLVQWFRQMEVLLKCGISVMRAIEICLKQCSDAALRRASTTLLGELRVGQRLSQAMSLAGSPFEPLHCGAVEVGERQGDLALVFGRLAEHSEKSDRVKRRLVSALAYPALVMSVSLLGLYLLIRFLAPVLVDVGEQLNQEPTVVSRIMVCLGELFESEVLTLTLGISLCLTLRWLLKFFWRKDRKRVEKCFLFMPLIGKILRLCVLIRICQTLETMLGGGLPLTDAFRLAAKNCGSVFYAEDVLNPTVDRITQGESLCASLQGSAGLPASFFGLLIAGEESGELELSFGHLSRLYEMELTIAVETFLAALEPISIAGVGLVVLGVLLSVFAPLSNLVSSV